MTALELEQAAQQIRASNHPAAQEIADLLDHTAHTLAVRENLWIMREYPPVVQADITRHDYGKEIAIAQALTGGEVAS